MLRLMLLAVDSWVEWAALAAPVNSSKTVSRAGIACDAWPDSRATKHGWSSGSGPSGALQDCSIMTATAEAKSGTSDNKTFQLRTGTAKL